MAVHPIGLDFSRHKIAIVPTEAFETKERLEKDKIGAGDDVFMVGRFVDHDGGPVNRPAVRFGNISVMPSSMEQPNGAMAEAYCIDLHSRPGYSGSPVFVYRTPGYDLEATLGPDMKDAKLLLAGANLLSLLGIHFAQFPEQWEIAFGLGDAQKEASSVPLISEGSYVKGLSGMTCVLPADAILEVLNSTKLKQLRDVADSVEQVRRDREGHPPEAEV